MKIVISSGHGKHISGAVGYIHEHDEAVKVVNRVAEYMRQAGEGVDTYEDVISTSQNENLNRIVDYHNSRTRDLDVSVHFNATPGAHGTECWYVTQGDLAAKVALEISNASGLTNRGKKHSSDLFFLNNTAKPAILIEVCFVDSKSDTDIYHNRFESICSAIVGAITGDDHVTPPDPQPPEPPTPPPDAGHPTIGLGDKGPAVVELQTALGVLIPDGDFGSITDTWVKAFQASCGLGVDGVVGPKTWAQVDALQARVSAGTPPLSPALAAQIYTMAQQSEIADYSWPGRGVPPQGYIAGMALSFAHALRRPGDAVAVMSKAQGNPDKDALAWYESEFRQLGMSNTRPGLDTLRHLFVMQIGLGPRESSGKYCEGRDMSASNVTSDTCEAGLFQTSWNIRSASSAIPPLLPEFWANPNGFLDVFKEGISPTASNLNSYGSGDGVRYQWLSRFCPLFHVMVTGVGMRVLRQHWGPINRREVTLKREADTLLRDVQTLVEDTPQA